MRGGKPLSYQELEKMLLRYANYGTKLIPVYQVYTARADPGPVVTAIKPLAEIEVKLHWADS